MTFHLTAKVGPLRYPFRGTVEVTDRQCIVDVDLMTFGRLLPKNKGAETLSDSQALDAVPLKALQVGLHWAEGMISRRLLNSLAGDFN